MTDSQEQQMHEPDHRDRRRAGRRARAVTLEHRIADAEGTLFATVGVTPEESFVMLPKLGLRIRTLSSGSGHPVLLLHGVTLSAAAWAPLFDLLPGCRLIAADLPGHGLSDPVHYRRGRVRAHSRAMIDELLDALGLDRVPVIGHSLGGMLALWYAAGGASRISTLVVFGDPAVALPGAHVRVPLSLLTVRGLGRAMLRISSPRAGYRQLLALGLGKAEVAASPAALVEALRLSARRPGNAATVASLMHALNRFRQPRPESVLTPDELSAIETPTAFIWGSDDPYLSPAEARPSIERMPAATLHEVTGGHGPWLVDAPGCAELIAAHIGAVGALGPADR
jgi:pimeloyl-ACP methyl ester carboxylesterase